MSLTLTLPSDDCAHLEDRLSEILCPQAQWLYPDDDMGKKKLESTDVHYKSDDGKARLFP